MLTLTDSEAEDGGSNDIVWVGGAEREAEDSDRGDDEAEVVEQQRVDPGEVSHPATEHSTHCVCDADDAEEERGFSLRDTLQQPTSHNGLIY